MARESKDGEKKRYISNSVSFRSILKSKTIRLGRNISHLVIGGTNMGKFIDGIILFWLNFDVIELTSVVCAKRHFERRTRYIEYTGCWMSLHREIAKFLMAKIAYIHILMFLWRSQTSNSFEYIFISSVSLSHRQCGSLYSSSFRCVWFPLLFLDCTESVWSIGSFSPFHLLPCMLGKLTHRRAPYDGHQTHKPRLIHTTHTKINNNKTREREKKM